MWTSRAPGRALAVAMALLAHPGAAPGIAVGSGPDGSEAEAAGQDSTDTRPTYRLDPIRIQADQRTPRDDLESLPGQASWLDLEPFRIDLTNTATVLDRLPGVRVHQHGSLGHDATASIRGASASQITVYLDGVPLTRGGAGLMNLAELPFSGIDNVEVYRGFAPASLPGASMGGAINLVSAGPVPRTSTVDGNLVSRSRIVAGYGSFDTRRMGLSHAVQGRDWDALVVADAMQSDGDFTFFDDNGTPWNTQDDDGFTTRRNNWVRSQEILARVNAPLGPTRLTFVNVWTNRRNGVAGLTSNQALDARVGLTHNLSNLQVRFPSGAAGRMRTSLRLFHDWRLDTFSDPEGKTGLGAQDNQDRTRTFGTQVLTEARLPWRQSLTTLVHLRQETFDPQRAWPQDATALHESRSQFELALTHVWTPGDRLAVHTAVRLTHENDSFSGDLKGTYSQGPARADTRRYVEPRVAARLRLVRGLFAEATYGRSHRAPTFLELFGNLGTVSGSSDLVPEEGTNRDVGLEWAGGHGAWLGHVEAAHFRNRVDHLIVLVPQSQRRFVARNIGGARMEGEELSWSLGRRGASSRLHLEGNLTRQRAWDLGVDRSWYADKTLPGRPDLEVFARLAVGWKAVDVAWQFEHVGLNHLDRFNLTVVPERQRHGVDVTLRLSSHLRLQGAVRNLNDARDEDVLGHPLPGRTYSLGSELAF